MASQEPANPRPPVTSALTVAGSSLQTRQGGSPDAQRSLSSDGVLVGVHAVPEALVPVGAQLAVGRQSLERLALEDAVVVQIVEDGGLEAEEASVDPALDLRFLVETTHEAAVVELGDAELELWADDCHRRQTSCLAVHARECRQIDVRDTVRIGDGEGSLADPFASCVDTAAGRGVETRVDAADLDPIGPWARLDPAPNLLTLVSSEQQKAREALCAVDRDHVPEDRASADLD